MLFFLLLFWMSKPESVNGWAWGWILVLLAFAEELTGEVADLKKRIEILEEAQGLQRDNKTSS